jgi:hypothetical protein
MSIISTHKLLTSRLLVGALGLGVSLLALPESAKALTTFPGGPADDLTYSLGSFKILVNPQFRSLFTTSPFYDPSTSTLTSPVLFDPSTKIGRSNPHIDGDATDIGGATVGTAGRIVSDSDFSIMPPEFELPGAREVHTNVESLLLTNNAGFNVRVGSQAPDRPISPGEVQSNATGGNIGNPNFDFPASSFFNVFAEVDIPGLGTVFNPTAMFLRGDENLTEFPPKVVYLHEGSKPVRVYFKTCETGIVCDPGQINENNVLGSLTLAGHGIGFTENEVDDFQFRLSQSSGVPPHPQDVPEPLTILGSFTAMGFGTFFKRKLGKKLQQEKA